MGLPLWLESKESACNAVNSEGRVPGLGRSPGEGNENPLQYSCLGSPTDRGAWWCIVHGVAKSQTQLSRAVCVFLLCISPPTSESARVKVCFRGCVCVDGKYIFKVVKRRQKFKETATQECCHFLLSMCADVLEFTIRSCKWCMKWTIPNDPWGNTLPSAVFLLIHSDYFLFSNLKKCG